jgi:integrase
MSIKTPRLIRDHCGVYYFRWIVPLPWRAALGKREIRRSLRTKDAASARHSALLLSAQMEALMAEKKAKPAAAGLPQLDDDLLAWMNNNQANKMRVRIFKDGSADIETDTDEEAKEARLIVEAHRREHAEEAVKVLPVSRSGTTLEQAKEAYIKERKVALSEKGTMPKVRGVLNAFIGFAGNVDVAVVQTPTVRAYKMKLLEDEKAGTTINDHIVILTGFFDYCIDNKIVAMNNPARGLLVKGAHNKAESYKPFTGQELGRIFAPAPYLKRMKLPDFYWGPLIALYTGARAEEIASLTVDQITSMKGVWIFDILQGKTENAERQVPIHDSLIELGLLDYCQLVRSAGHTQLFPHLINGKNGFKKNMTRAFAEHLDSPEVNIKDPLKVFHSFRHTVVTMLTDKGVNDGQKRFLVGHDIDTRTSSHDDYIHGEGMTFPNLRAAINRLHFETVDVPKLKREQAGFVAAALRRIEQQKVQAAKKAERAKGESAGAG